MNVAPRTWLLALAALFIVVALVAARPVATPGPALRDFEAYWSAGAAWNSHTDPYGRTIWNVERGVPGVDASRDELLPYVGPPQALPIFGLIARLPYRLASRVWGALLSIAFAVLAIVAIRASGSRLDIRAFIAAVALGVGFGPLTSDLALGQIALLALLGACAVPIAARASTGAAAIGTFVASLQPNVALGLASQLGYYRAVVAIAAGVVAAYVVGAIAAGWQWPLAYLQTLAAHGAAERFTAIQLSPASIAYGFGVAPRTASVLGIFVAIAAIVTAVAVALRVRDSFARFAAFGTLTPFVAGFFHEHDLIVGYLAAIWCALRTQGPARGYALAGTLLVAVDWLGLAQRPTGIAQSALLAGAAFCAFIALGTRAEFGVSVAGALPVAALFGAGAWLAATHPAPIWPDTLGQFHAAPALPIATVWLDEQRSAGLLRLVPAWAGLRALSLLGCALLAYAIYRHSSCRRTASPIPDENL